MNSNGYEIIEDRYLGQLRNKIISDVTDYDNRMKILKEYRSKKYGMREINRDEYTTLKLSEVKI